jgi:signal peptidase I
MDTPSGPPRSVEGTIRAVLLTPRAFFSNPPASGAGRAVAIALLVHAVADPLAELGMGFVGTVSSPRVLSRLVTGPVSGLIGIYLPALIVYALARFVPGERRTRFGAVVACLAYAQIAFLLGIVPVVGTIGAGLYWIWLCALAVRYALRRSLAFAWMATLGAPVLFVALAVVLRMFFTEAFKIPASSMAPTLLVGDHIFVSEMATAWAEGGVPDRGDVVVFRFPENRAQDFVKRVVGRPGDRIVVKDGIVQINGWKVPTCTAGTIDVRAGDSVHSGDLVVEFVDDNAYLVFHDAAPIVKLSFGDVQGPYVVAPGEVFVLGDNRENSHDSRGWYEGRGGGVPVVDIKGRANVIWLSFDAAGGLAWSRIGSSLTGPPRCHDGFPPETCAGIARCLAGRPPRSATTPPPPNG